MNETHYILIMAKLTWI